MKLTATRKSFIERCKTSSILEKRLVAYAAASAGVGLTMASDATAVIVSSSTVQNVGINGVASIDFNGDGQTDFQIDHDRVDLTSQGGPVVDYLQVDKNDVNGEANPLDVDPLDGFIAKTFTDGSSQRNDANQAGYLVDTAGGIAVVQYPKALLSGAEIGPTSVFDYQEGTNVYGSGRTGRLQRLIDEDHGQVDMLLGGKTADQIVEPTNTPQWAGLENQTRYIGVKMDLNDFSQNNTASEYYYGWIGVKITNEADATGQVVGWGYESTPGTAITAGATAPGVAGDYDGNGKVDAADYVLWRNGGPLQNEVVTGGTVGPEDYTAWRAAFGNPGSGSGSAVPEPGSALLALLGGLAMLGTFVFRRLRRR